MTNEPVAYYKDFSDGTRLFFKSNELCDIDNSDNLIKPLYTKEQLQPRVKMTKKQYNRLMWDKENTDLFQCLDYFYEHDGNSKFGALTEDLRGDLAPEDIARAWLDEETIEIVPTKRWFVQKKDFNGDYRFLKISTKDLSFNYTKDKAAYFDTKEEAEEWCNPLTKAVLLPVEENNND